MRKREITLKVRVNEKELEQIKNNMAEIGTINREAYLRKIAIDGYLIKLDIPELKDLISLLRRTSNNINQIAKRVNETGRVYSDDLEEISRKQEELWSNTKKIIDMLSRMS